MKTLNSQQYQILQYALTFIFLLFCGLHYFSARPLWLDENIVLKSLTDFSYGRLFGVLAYEQIFPRIPMVILKYIGSLVEFHPYAVRSLSFLSMLGAFFVWMKIYLRQIDNKMGVVLCLLAFACSYRLAYYAAELKPYAMDVLTVGLYSLYLLRLRKNPEMAIKPMDYLCAGLLPFLNCYAYATIFIFWLVPVNLIIITLKDKRFCNLALVSCAASAAALGLMYFTDLQFMLNNSGTKSRNWESYFVCTENFGCFASTVGEGIKRLTTYWFGNAKIFVQMSVIFIPFAVFAGFKYGIRSIWKYQGEVVTVEAIALVLLIELFVFGVFHKYPFTGERITLYLAPFIFYLIYRGLNAIPIKPIRWFMLGYYALFCCVCLINTLIWQINLY